MNIPQMPMIVCLNTADRQLIGMKSIWIWENFFPSIEPQVLFQFIRERFPLKWKDEDILTAEAILRKLLLFEMDKLDTQEWRWYLNTEEQDLPQGRFFARGLPQGLPHTYFMANLFMLLIQEKYKEVFPGEMFFM